MVEGSKWEVSTETVEEKYRNPENPPVIQFDYPLEGVYLEYPFHAFDPGAEKLEELVEVAKENAGSEAELVYELRWRMETKLKVEPTVISVKEEEPYSTKKVVYRADGDDIRGEDS